MSRIALHLAILLCPTSVSARAEDAPPQPSAAVHSAAQKKATRVQRKSAKTEGAVPAAQSIVGGPTAVDGGHSALDVEGPKKGTGGDSAWSVSPQWNAANGGSTVSYGSRALINELQSNPAETTGYGAGAKVDFHF